ncbi:MAG: T9SS type A sorting domain-containing protein [Ignavibacteriales bacterium]|nr:T9SS type A sorting domain-containing protein [Ignavibacteriales bacterium]
MNIIFHKNIVKLLGISFFIILFCGSIFGQQKSVVPILKSNGGNRIILPSSSPSAVLYDQTATVDSFGTTSQDFETIYDAYDNQAADDFKVPSGVSWSVTRVFVPGFYTLDATPTVDVWFYQNNRPTSLPGTQIYSALGIVPTLDATGTLTIDLPTPADLCSGTWWVSVQANLDFGAGSQWYWLNSFGQLNSESGWENLGNGFATGCDTTWHRRVTDCLVGDSSSFDMAFRLEGTVGSACAITVTVPNGGESWALGSTHDVTWTDNIPDNVSISLLKGFTKVLTISPNTPSDGLFSWTIPTTLTPGSDYKVQIQGKVNRVKDKSNGNFTLTAATDKSLTEVELAQNYPNPFNPSTIISYAIPFEGNVNIIVYNVMGETVSELVNSVQQPGNYQTEFNASNIAAGMYFYRINAKSLDGKQNFTESRKMLLLK